MRTALIVVAIFLATVSYCQEPSDDDDYYYDDDEPEDYFDDDDDDTSITENPGIHVNNDTETSTPEIEATTIEKEENVTESVEKISNITLSLEKNREEENATESDLQIVEKNSNDVIMSVEKNEEKENATESDFQIVEKNSSDVTVPVDKNETINEKPSEHGVSSNDSDRIVDKTKPDITLMVNSTQPPTTTNSTKLPPVCLNCTTISSTTTNNPSSNDKASFFSSFNLNYLYLLLLIIPISAVLIGGYCYCRRKKRKLDGYVEPRVQKSKRLSTPSWVFSEPDFHDEEVTTLEEEKKL